MKFILSILLFISINSFAQQADFIILKKHNKKIKTWFAGDNIVFTTVTGANINATITGMKDDTLYLQEFVVRRLMTVYGAYINDTAGSYHYKYHYNQIKVIAPQERRGFNLQASGYGLMGGSILLTFGSGLVYLFDRKKFSAPLLGAAVGLGVVGYFLSKVGTKGMTIGRKYKLEYMNMSNKPSR